MFARHYLRNLGWFLFLELLRCFSSLGSLYSAYIFSRKWPLRAGFPHSDISGSKLICQLPEAFRRLSRLSSPVIAKASTICTYSLDPITLSTGTAYNKIKNIQILIYSLFYAKPMIVIGNYMFVTLRRLIYAMHKIQSNPLIHYILKTRINSFLVCFVTTLLLPFC